MTGFGPFQKTATAHATTATALVATLVALLLAVFDIPAAQAEFRVFRLKIVNSETGTDREVVSRLDDLQYAGYFPIKRSESVTIEQTWMCYERNDYTGTLCPPPPESPDRNLASPPR